MSFENPFPVEGTITVEENITSYKFPCATEWMSETEHGNKLQAAGDRVARMYDDGTEVRVRFTDDGHGVCNHFEVLGPADEVEA